MSQPSDGVHPVRPQEDDRLLEVWEASVRATHHFLTEADIQYFKPMVLPGLWRMDHLHCVRDTEALLIGFVGVDEGKMEALFIHPSWRRMGVGRRLAEHALHELGAAWVDVNEQNRQAVDFYLHLGYRIEGRSELDGMGKPFPILHMKWHGGDSRGDA